MKALLDYGRGTAEIVGAVLMAAFIGYGIYWYFAPRYVAVDNQVFHNSQQYNDGMVNRLEQYQESYALASSPAAKDAIRSIVRHEFASYPEDRLNPDLRQFLDTMKGGL